jgi:aromatic ring-opening dioxygenase LigB subunit
LSTKRIAVVISGDLSHYHSHDPKAPYPFDPSSTVFDGFIKDWAMLDRNPSTEEKSSQTLLKDAMAVSDSAGSCGYTGLVMLHGMLRELVLDGYSFKNNFYEYAAPTYFGMTVTSWVPE